jgi:hypothetical protein
MINLYLKTYRSGGYMIKKIIFMLFVIFTISFGQINDSGNYLTKDDKEKIEKKISEIEKNGDIVYYVNIGRKIDDKDIIKKTIILNIIPDGKDDVNVQLKFTQDIDVSSYEGMIDNLLVESEDLISKKEYKTFIFNTLDLSEKIVNDIAAEKRKVEEKEAKKVIIENKFAGIIVLLLIAISIFVTLKFVKMRGIRKN